jgi:Flp pilus assembly protein TadD
MHFLFQPFFIVVFGLFSMLGLPSLAAGTSDGSSTANATAADGYAEAKATVDSGNYAAALPMLVTLTKAEPQNADAWNLLGFTYRKLEQYKDSNTAYLKVLTINPNHLGALEYQGELFLTTGKVDGAKANLAKLKGLCGNCEEYQDLEKAMKAAGV